MKSLLVLRHAKSDWENPKLEDHDRPLSPRGERAAVAMGRYIRQKSTVPDLILCSTARRATETKALVAAQWAADPPTEYDRALYLAGCAALVERLARAPDRHARVMVVGHNPDLQLLLGTLGAASDPDLLAQIEAKFPTAAFAHLELPIDRWADLPGAVGRIIDYAIPKGLL